MGVDYLGSEAAFLDSQGDILLAGDSQYYFGGSQHQEVNFLQETSFLSVLGNGQVWIGLAQSTPDYSLYYAQALDDPSASYVCLYSKIDEGTDWVSYFFYFKSATGGAYLGLGYDNATETTGYLIGQEEGNPDNTFTGFYTQIAEKTYNYVYNFNNGDMFGGTGYADFPAGYFYGSSPMSMGFFSGQYYFSPTPTYPAMSYWSLVYSVALLDYLEQ
jgi:hypothetical protein